MLCFNTEDGTNQTRPSLDLKTTSNKTKLIKIKTRKCKTVFIIHNNETSHDQRKMNFYSNTKSKEVFKSNKSVKKDKSKLILTNKVNNIYSK